MRDDRRSARGHPDRRSTGRCRWRRARRRRARAVPAVTACPRRARDRCRAPRCWRRRSTRLSSSAARMRRRADVQPSSPACRPTGARRLLRLRHDADDLGLGSTAGARDEQADDEEGGRGRSASGEELTLPDDGDGLVVRFELSRARLIERRDRRGRHLEAVAEDQLRRRLLLTRRGRSAARARPSARSPAASSTRCRSPPARAARSRSRAASPACPSDRRRPPRLSCSRTRRPGRPRGTPAGRRADPTRSREARNARCSNDSGGARPLASAHFTDPEQVRRHAARSDKQTQQRETNRQASHPHPPDPQLAATITRIAERRPRKFGVRRR